MPLTGSDGLPIDVLLVEDNPGDVLLVEEAFRDSTLVVRLHIARDGEEAIQFLRREGAHAEALAPDLLLLDLNLPRMGGLEVLGELKADPQLRAIPVVVLTSSSAQEDIEGAYDRYANCYITKPGDLDELVDVIRSIEAFWLSLVRLPGRVVA